MSQRWRRWLVPLGWALLVYLALGDLAWLSSGQFIGGSDLGSDLDVWFLPSWQFALDSLRQGVFPLWNPYLGSGVPFAANPQPALFYPPVWMITLLPLTRAVVLLFLGHIGLAGWGMTLWLRDEGADEAGAWLGGAIFAFGGYFFSRIYAGHVGVVMTQAWLPWILLACRRALTQRRWPTSVLAALPVAMCLLAGHTASVLYVALIAGAYVFYTLWQQGIRRATDFARALAPIAWMGAVGLALAAIQLLPTLEFLAHSTRQERAYTFAAEYAWPPGYWLTLLVPNFFGNPTLTGYWGDGRYEELIFYVGILPLALLVGMAGRLRHRLKPLLVGLTLAGLLLALGPFGITHRLAFRLVPLFQVTRAPARAGFVFSFAVAALAAFAWTWMGEAPDAARRALERRGLRGLAWGLGALAVGITALSFMLFTLHRDSNPEVGRLWHTANYAALFGLWLGLSALLLAAWRQGQLSRRMASMLAVALVLADLWGYGRPLLRPMPLSESAAWHAVHALTEGQPGRVLPWGWGLFDQNLGMSLGVESTFGYDPLEIGWYRRFIAAVDAPEARAYDTLGVRWLAALHEMPSRELVGEHDGVWLYERPDALPRAWLVHIVEVEPAPEVALARFNAPDFDPRHAALLEEAALCAPEPAAQPGTVQIVARNPNRIIIEADTATDALLVLGEVWYPGWRARVAGRSVPVLRVNTALRGVCVSAGRQRVEVYFRPVSLQIGAVLTGCAVILVLAAAGKRWREQQRAL